MADQTPPCPSCGAPVTVFYTAPLTAQCSTCGTELVEVSHPAIRVLTDEEGRSKRPSLYGEPMCTCCSHAPHPGDVCRWCSEPRAPLKWAVTRVI